MRAQVVDATGAFLCAGEKLEMTEAEKYEFDRLGYLVLREFMTPAETDEWLQHNQVFELVFGERMPVEKESYMESAQQLLKARRFAWPFASSGAETACGAV